MKNLNFVDPGVVEQVFSKQEILNYLRERLHFDIAYNEWLDSITNDIALSLDEADLIYQLFGIYNMETYEPSDISKLDLLFNREFFSDVQNDTLLLKRFFRTELFDSERIKSFPLLFKKIGDKEIFDRSIGYKIKEIKAYCTQNKEFAEAYQTKLSEIQNNNMSLQERLDLYLSLGYTDDLIRELEQPAFEMFRDYLNGVTISGYSKCDLFFISLLQTPDGIQMPRWDEGNYLCRLLLDNAITSNIDILNKLFRGYTTTDVFLIICNHLKWNKDNTSQFFSNDNQYAQFLETQLPELFSGNMSQKYSELCLDLFNLKKEYLEKWQGTEYRIPDFPAHYLTRKIVSAIFENNHEQIREISNLFDNEYKDLLGNESDEFVAEYRDAFYPHLPIPRDRGHLDWLRSRISSAMKFFESGDHAEKWRDILIASKNDHYFLESLLFFLLKNKKDASTISMSLEAFAQQYIPPEIFPEIIHFDFLQELNEDIYLDIIQQYPGLSREEALLDRLLPCFTAITIKDTDKMLALLDRADDLTYHRRSSPWHLRPEKNPVLQLFLCVLDQLCERHEKEDELIALIFEIIFREKCCIPVTLDIIKKYPQVQQLVFEHCYTILQGSLDTPICTPISSHQIQAGIPAYIIGMYKGLWHGLKPLLIALRKTRIEWVNENLDNDSLVYEIKRYFEFFSESLKSLRQDMANGLSDWLKPLPESKRVNLKKRLAEFPEIEKDREGFDITYTEPDPIWRYAYVRAIADLGVDVDGKGHYIHSIMDKVAKEDPSEMVRKAAEKASARLKNLRNGWDGDKHYQKIILAFWWIKQASRLALNLPVDKKGALEKRRDDSRVYEYDYEDEEEGEQMNETRQKLMRARLKI